MNFARARPPVLTHTHTRTHTHAHTHARASLMHSLTHPPAHPPRHPPTHTDIWRVIPSTPATTMPPGAGGIAWVPGPDALAAPTPAGSPAYPLRVASFNMLNFFATLGYDAPLCGPEGDENCRGADGGCNPSFLSSTFVCAHIFCF